MPLSFQPVRHWLPHVAVVVAAFLAEVVGRLLLTEGSGMPPVGLACAVGVAATVLVGWRAIPGLFVGTLAGALLSGSASPTAVGLAVGIPLAAAAVTAVPVAWRTAEAAELQDRLARVEWVLQQRQAAEQAEREKERLAAVGQMASGMSHHCRNALQRCKACLEMLGLELRDNARGVDLVGRVKKAQDDLLHLFEEVREYAAPITLKQQPCHLGELVRQVWKPLADSHVHREVRFSEHDGGVDLHCAVDRYAIVEAFRPLFQNALAVCGHPGEITIRWFEDVLPAGPALRVAIRDSGRGLNEEEARRLFEPFFSVRTAGMGLGMAIAKRIVEAHGGQIAVDHVDPPGAVIVVRLPRGKP